MKLRLRSHAQMTTARFCSTSAGEQLSGHQAEQAPLAVGGDLPIHRAAQSPLLQKPNFVAERFCVVIADELSKSRAEQKGHLSGLVEVPHESLVCQIVCRDVLIEYPILPRSLRWPEHS